MDIWKLYSYLGNKIIYYVGIGLSHQNSPSLSSEVMIFTEKVLSGTLKYYNMASIMRYEALIFQFMFTHTTSNFQ